MRIIAGCPVKDRGWIIGRSLASIAPQVDGLFYLVNDTTDDTEDYLWSLDYEVWNTGDPHSARDARSESNMARVFNRWLDRSLERDWDYLMLWSSDMVAGPGMVERLHQTHAELGPDSIVGPVYPTGERSLNVFEEESSGRIVRSVVGKRPGACLSTGCSLLPRSAVESGARHAPHPQSHVFPWYKMLHNEGFCVHYEPRVYVEHHMARDKVYTWDGA